MDETIKDNLIKVYPAPKFIIVLLITVVSYYMIEYFYVIFNIY
jgi:hypothetical protein